MTRQFVINNFPPNGFEHSKSNQNPPTHQAEEIHVLTKLGKYPQIPSKESEI